MADDEFLNTDQLAQLLHTVPSTVRYWRFNGTGPVGFRVGRRVLYRRSAVAEWLNTCEATDAADRAAAV